MNEKKVYFPNLDGLRGIAALLVVFVHINQLASMLGANLKNPFFAIEYVEFGKFAVSFFFVLSGFLISYLILNEEKQNLKINIKLFYLKRVLRIWPIYYLMIFISFFLLPNIIHIETYVTPTNDWHLFTLYMIFLSNVANTYDIVIGASHLWTIGIEEQFYLLWPLFFLFIKKNRLIKTVFIFVFLLIVRAICYNHCPDFLFRFNSFLYISCLIGGSLFGIIVFENHKLLKYIKNRYVFIIALIFALVMLFVPYRPNRFDYERFVIPFGVIVVYLGTMYNTRLFLEWRLFKFLGRISYGIYVYHVFVITILIYVLKYLDLLNSSFLYILSFLSTILVAHLSFKYFESFFIRLRRFFKK